jgi:serine/threonine protein kinase
MSGAFSKRYDLLKTIGHPGSYGKIHGAVCRASGAQLAVKVMAKPASETTRRERTRLSLMKTEALIAMTVRHPRIVRVVEVLEDAEKLYLVMERYNGGDLFDRVMQYDGRLPEQAASAIFYDLLSAVEHCHANKIVHGDIKLSNIMFADVTDSSIRLIDFGMSQFCSDGQVLTEMVGTPNYQSPDVIAGTYSFESDCWSLGVVLFIMIFGFNPFDPFGKTESVTAVHKRVMAGFLPITKSGYGAFFPSETDASDEVKEVIGNLLRFNPHTRMTVRQAKLHPWVVAGMAPRRPSATQQIVELAPCA